MPLVHLFTSDRGDSFVHSPKFVSSAHPFVFKTRAEASAHESKDGDTHYVATMDDTTARKPLVMRKVSSLRGHRPVTSVEQQSDPSWSVNPTGSRLERVGEHVLHRLARTKAPAGGAIVNNVYQRGGQFLPRAAKHIRSVIAAYLKTRVQMARAAKKALSESILDKKTNPLPTALDDKDITKNVAGGKRPGSVADATKEVENKEPQQAFTKGQLKKFEDALGLLPDDRRRLTNRGKLKGNDVSDETVVQHSPEEVANFLDYVSGKRLRASVKKKAVREALRNPQNSAHEKLAFLADHMAHEATIARENGAEDWYGDHVAAMARHLHDTFHEGKPGDDEMWGKVDPKSGRVVFDPTGNTPDPAGLTLAKMLVAATSSGNKPDLNYDIAWRMLKAGHKNAAGDHDIFSTIPEKQEDEHWAWVKDALKQHDEMGTQKKHGYKTRGDMVDDFLYPGKSLEDRVKWFDKFIKPLGEKNARRFKSKEVTYVDAPDSADHAKPVWIHRGGGEDEQKLSPYGGRRENADPATHPDDTAKPPAEYKGDDYSGRLASTYRGKGALRKADIPMTDEQGKLVPSGWSSRDINANLDALKSVIGYFREQHPEDTKTALKHAAKFFLEPQSKDSFRAVTDWAVKNAKDAEHAENLKDKFERSQENNRGFFADHEELPGAFLLGPKFGAFASNLHLDVPEGSEWDARRKKYGAHLTADMWWSRTWNRYLGTLFGGIGGRPRAKGIKEEPRGDRERKQMRAAATAAAKHAGLRNVAELQAVLWYYEQQLYRWLGAKADSKSYLDGVNLVQKKQGKGERFSISKKSKKINVGQPTGGSDAEE